MENIIEISRTMADKIGAHYTKSVSPAIRYDGEKYSIGVASDGFEICSYAPADSSTFTGQERKNFEAYKKALDATRGKSFWDCDYYQVTEIAGIKTVIVDGYYYDTGDDEELSSRIVCYSDVEYPLDEFVQMVKASDEFRNEITEFASTKKQYIEDLKYDEALSNMQYFYDEPATPLLYEELTLDTPCGLYIDGLGEEIKEED